MRAWVLFSSLAVAVASIATHAQRAGGAAQGSAQFDVTEASIAQIHAAMTAKRLTCRALVTAYQARIAAHDKQGAALNAITQMNDAALADADALDRRFASGGLSGR